MADPIDVSMTVGGITYRGTLQPDAPPPPPPPPPPVRPTFSVWTGAQIPGQYQTPAAIATAIRALCPWPDANVEWWIKAGEGGSWEGEWDLHQLALGGPDDLLNRCLQMRDLGARLVPWVVLRGRPEWEAGEFEVIRDCTRISGACALNLEPGDSYWNGPTTPGAVSEWLGRLGVARDSLWLTAIPRTTATDALGGPETMKAWLAGVAGASWECYDATSMDLSPDLALPRVAAWNTDASPWKQIPIVQRSRIGAWQDSHWATLAMQVWTLGGD